MNTKYNIKCTRGRGYLVNNFNTAFDIESNWTTKKKNRKAYDTFNEALADAEAFFRKGFVSIVEAK